MTALTARGRTARDAGYALALLLCAVLLLTAFTAGQSRRCSALQSSAPTSPAAVSCAADKDPR